MDQRQIDTLETEIEPAVAAAIGRLGLSQLPLLPSSRTIHLMAKAAVTVYESAVDNQTSGDPS